MADTNSMENSGKPIGPSTLDHYSTHIAANVAAGVRDHVSETPNNLGSKNPGLYDALPKPKMATAPGSLDFVRPK